MVAIIDHSPFLGPHLHVDPKIRRCLIAVAILNTILNIPQIVLPWFQCDPPKALWDPSRQNDCDPRISVYYTYFAGAVAALSDFFLASIPITMLAPLRIDRTLKWGLSFLMGCGVFAGVAALVRTWAASLILGADPTCKCPLEMNKSRYILLCSSLPPS